MKKVFTSLCTMFFLLVLLTDSKAATYYVTNGEEFSLAPAAGSNFYQYQWTIDPGSSPITKLVDQLTGGGALVHTFEDALTTPKVHKIALGVLSEVGGCLSDVIEHTIVVLPKITVEVTADKLNFCEQRSVNAELTATVTAVTGLDTYSVSLSPLVWKKDGVVVSGQTLSTLTATAAGKYECLVSYVLPETGTYGSNGSKLGSAITTKTVDILNNLPLPSTPSITLK